VTFGRRPAGGPIGRERSGLDSTGSLSGVGRSGGRAPPPPSTGADVDARSLPSADGESLTTILVALVTNVVITVAKIAAGLLGSSPALLSEGAHSVADSFNQLLLLAAIKRSGRPADRDHPFGYGKERFFYSLLAGVGIFVAGAGFSVYEGVTSLLNPEAGGDFVLKYAVLGASLLLEGVSWLRAMNQLRREARGAGQSVFRHMARSTDPTVKTVALEDSAAIVGLIVAFAGVALDQATGRSTFDAIASLAIGGLLFVVAIRLVRDNKDFLIGQAAEPEIRQAIEELLVAYPEVTSVIELLTQVMGPNELLVAVRIDFDDNLTGAQVEDVSARIDEELYQSFPQATHVFLHAAREKAGRRPPEVDVGPNS